jgi:hypothetical protein
MMTVTLVEQLLVLLPDDVTTGRTGSGLDRTADAREQVEARRAVQPE